MRHNRRRPPARRELTPQHRINDKIVASEVRLIMEGSEPIVVSTAKALAMADEQEMDLVEIAAKSSPPVCKIMDYKKLLYNQKRKQYQTIKHIYVSLCVFDCFTVIAI